MRNHLMFRLIIMNMCGVALLLWSMHHGFFQSVVSDPVSYTIVGLFLIGMISVCQRAKRVTHLMNLVKQDRIPRYIEPEKFLQKMEHLHSIPAWCAGLGFLGTLWGIKIAMASLGESGISTAVEAQSSLPQLFVGMNFAVNTTLTALVAAIWLEINTQTLRTAAVCMLDDLRVLKEAHDGNIKFVHSVRGAE